MKFKCELCENTIEIYKVKFTQKENDLVCEMAICCNSYMDQVLTDEYKGMPDIHRDADDTQHSNPMREWDKFKSDNAEKP